MKNWTLRKKNTSNNECVDWEASVYQTEIDYITQRVLWYMQYIMSAFFCWTITPKKNRGEPFCLPGTHQICLNLKWLLQSCKGLRPTLSFGEGTDATGVSNPQGMTPGFPGKSTYHHLSPRCRDQVDWKNWNQMEKKRRSTIPEINSSPRKETIVFQPSIFRCYVGFREGALLSLEVNFQKLQGDFSCKVSNRESIACFAWYPVVVEQMAICGSSTRKH